MSRLLALAALVASFATAARAEAPPVKVAALPLQNGAGIDAPTAATLTDALVTTIRRLPGVTCITNQELNAVLTLEQQRQAIGCTGANCSIDLGRTLGVERLVFGSIGKLGETFLLSLRLVDAKTGEVVKQSEAQQKGKAIDDLLQALPGVASELFGRAATTPGNIAQGNTTATTTTFGKPATVDTPVTFAADVMKRLVVLTDGKGGFIAYDTERETSGTFYAGDANKLFAQRVYGGGRNGADWSATFWEPRVTSGWMSSFQSKEGKHTLQCAKNELAFTVLDAAARAAFLSKAAFFEPRWRRRAHAIARDDEGTWYFVDRTRDTDSFDTSEFRIFVGRKGKLVALELEDYIGDDGGQLWITPIGKLKIDDANKSAEWIERSVRTKLVWLDIEDNARFAYSQLGVYKDERLGTACDERL